jgi:hypothetical protein
VPNEPGADRPLAPQQDHGCVEMLFGSELGDAPLVAGMRDNQSLVGSVDDPGSGANELGRGNGYWPGGLDQRSVAVLSQFAYGPDETYMVVMKAHP